MTSIERYDAAAQSIAGPIHLQGWSDGRLARVPGRGMALTAIRYRSPGARLLALLGPDGAVLWSKEGAALGVSRPAITGAGQIALSMTPLSGPSETTLEVYGADGSLLWTHLAPADIAREGYPKAYYEIAGDADGNLTVATADDNGFWVRRIRAGGEPEWLRKLLVNPNIGFAVEYETGRVFVGADEPPDHVIIQELSPDGEVYRKHAHPWAPMPRASDKEAPNWGPDGGIPTLQRLALAPAGELLFVTFVSVGRFRRIEHTEFLQNKVPGMQIPEP